MKVLCIVSSPKPDDESLSKLMAYEFVKEYKSKNPADIVEILDLYKEPIEYLQYSTIKDAQYNNCGKMVEISNEFASFDKYIISAPMWNLSIPSILKSYLDYIVAKGISFKYNKYKIPIGLLKNKKAIYLGTRGGSYPFPLSLLTSDFKYIKCILKFIGVKDISSIFLENVDKYPKKREVNIEKVLKKIKLKAKEF